jgi:hypothetical protein
VRRADEDKAANRASAADFFGLLATPDRRIAARGPPADESQGFGERAPDAQLTYGPFPGSLWWNKALMPPGALRLDEPRARRW